RARRDSCLGNRRESNVTPLENIATFPRTVLSASTRPALPLPRTVHADVADPRHKISRFSPPARIRLQSALLELDSFSHCPLPSPFSCGFAVLTSSFSFHVYESTADGP